VFLKTPTFSELKDLIAETNDPRYAADMNGLYFHQMMDACEGKGKVSSF
jgi:hypothetical protein